MGMWNVVATPWSVQSVGSQVYNFFSDRLGELKLAPDVKQAFDKARQDISDMDMIRRTSAAVRKLRYGDGTDEILQLLEIGQFQHANHVMQPLLTAMPEYRKLYNQKMAAGFENGYSQHDAFRGSAYMHTDENYREVTDGMLNQYDDHIWTWVERHDRSNRLDMFAKIDMLSNWDRMRAMDWEDEDPLSELNASC
jgi:hypothetical protein